MHKSINAVLNQWPGVAIHIWTDHGGRYTLFAEAQLGVVIYSRLASNVVRILAIVNFLYNNCPENSRCSYIGSMRSFLLLQVAEMDDFSTLHGLLEGSHSSQDSPFLISRHCSLWVGGVVGCWRIRGPDSR